MTERFSHMFNQYLQDNPSALENWEKEKKGRKLRVIKGNVVELTQKIIDESQKYASSWSERTKTLLQGALQNVANRSWAREALNKTLQHNTELTEMYLQKGMISKGLLPLKGFQVGGEFLDIAAIEQRVQEAILFICNHQPESVTQCNMFMNYITERTLMGNLVEGLEGENMVSPFFEVMNAGEDIGRVFLVSNRFVSTDSFMKDYKDVVKTSQIDIEVIGANLPEGEAGKNEIIPSETLDHAVIIRHGTSGQRNIIGIYVMNRVPSMARLGINLRELASSHPEFAPYYQYFIEQLNNLLSR